MKAAVLKTFGSPLAVEEVPAPILGTGEVIVDMVAAGMLAYAKEVFSGQRQYLLETPVIPGASGIGRIRVIGPDATKLAVGDWVVCDPTVRSRDDVMAPDITLQGLSAAGEGGLKMQRYHHDGSFAEQMRTPTENVFRLGDIDPADAPRWCRIGSVMVPYGGLLSIGFGAGETLVVNGATGKFGAAAVEVALAMGAAWVVATGRNETVLQDLVRRFGRRIHPVVMTGDETADRAAILRAAPGSIDCVFDILPPVAKQTQVRAAALTVRPNGRISLMGGVGMQGGDDLSLPYAWLMRNNITVRGQWMYPREAVVRMIAMIKTGLIDLQLSEITTFPLAEVNTAVEHAAANAGPFQMTVVLP
jgi:alcohol dehydrogenase